MFIPSKKLKNGFSLPVLGYGTWRMAGGELRDYHYDDESDISSLQNAIAQGVTHIDTAEMYARGHAEEIVGTAIHKFDRKKLFIATKVWKTHLHHDDVLAACEKSLKRLQVSYIDLYFLHMPDSSVPIKETVSAMDKLKSQGLVKNIGICNANVETLQKVQETSSYKIVCNQVHYNLLVREPERSGLLQYCQFSDILLSAWRPLEKGSIANPNNQLLQNMCKKYNKTPIQIALNWLISQENVVTITKMSGDRHQKENLGSIGWNLHSSDIEIIRREYPEQVAISPAVSLR
jgi:diketogulonate reductase-like aldo/keto reductase